MFQSIEQIKATNRRNGGFWFSPDTLRFFNCRVAPTVHQLSEADGALFVTSEQRESYTPRLYTVRRATPDGKIDTVGEFMSFTTASKAQRAARLVTADFRARGSWDTDAANTVCQSAADAL